MVKAIYAGSFNPIHKGHLDIIKQASQIFDLIVLISNNGSKSYAIDQERRKNLVKKYLIDNGIINVTIDILGPNKLLANYAADKEIHFLVRSFRNGTEADSELQMAFANESICRKNELRTVFIQPDINTLYLSSSLIREIERTKNES